MSRRNALDATSKGASARSEPGLAPAVGTKSSPKGTSAPKLRGARRQAPGQRAQPRATLRDTLGRMPTAAWICALIALVNAACWSVLSPPFELPDEPAHFAYVQHLAETGHLPTSSLETYPPAEEVVLDDLLQPQVRFSQENHTISTLAEQQTLERDLAQPLSRSQPGDAGLAASQPPLYYALQTIPYALGSSGTLLDRLELMRLLSALMGAFTALFAFLFLREALPGAPWAWTVGGLGVALAPALAMMSGAVNPDALLFTVSTALFYSLARGFRRGLTRRLAIAIGAVIAIGCMTKLTFLGLLPGAVFGLLVLAIRAARRSGRSAYGALAIALAIAASPALLYLTLSLGSGRSSLGVFHRAITLVGHYDSTPNPISYIWQLYLPRLPGMRPVFHGTSGSALWFEQLVGKYGWLDTAFPGWVLRLAVIPAGVIAVLFARALLVSRDALRRRGLEVATYALMALGILVMIGGIEYAIRTPGEYTQFRYLLPMVALMGAILALAARGAGRRWGPLAGVFIVMLLLAHDLFSQLLVVSRYYG